jgi:hypothetical protein
MKTAFSLAFVLSLLLTPVFAQADMSGEWAIEFNSPQGPQEFTMYVQQQGPRLTGRLTSEYGEFPLRGSLDGKVDGDSMTGTAKLGNRGTGQLTGTRTGQ